MHDIKIPDPHGKKVGFEVSHVMAQEEKKAEPGDKVKVKFKNFVELVATHDFEEVMRKYEHEDIIVSTNLLTDLANAHEEEPEQSHKTSILFIAGILLGVVVTYLIIRFL